jgi:hypothetical protein
MKFKFLGTAAALLGAVSTAQAADLGKKAPAAVDYVKVCDAYGAGFFYIPGGETCLKIGGFVRARAFVGSDNREGTASKLVPATSPLDDSNRGSTYGTAIQASVTFDARTGTEIGVLRSFIDYRANVRTSEIGTTGFGLDKAFIQFGGLTAGLASSAFNYHTGYSLGTSYSGFWGDINTTLISYTFTSGPISATLSLEDANASRLQGKDLAKSLLDIGIPQASGLTTYSASYGGLRAPDFVANANFSQGWGSADLAVAAHQNYTNSATGGDDWGYAVQGGLEINLPMIAAGNKVAFTGAYTEGALKYLNLGGYGVDFLVPGTTLAAVFTPDGKAIKTKAWSVNGSFLHNFAPALSAAVDVGYADVDHAGPNDFNILRVSGSTTYTVAAGFTVAAGLEYQRVSFSSETKAVSGILGDTDALVGVLQLRRGF